IRIDTGLNDFILSIKQWITKVNAIGLYSSAGRYGGTYAHKDIAFQFATWMSATFYLYLIQEFQQLKEKEAKRLNIEWNIRRELAKAHYPMLKEAVIQHLPTGKKKAGFYLADEADLINELVFGMKTINQ
ncbi:MAG: KilA-N domain-containing protein, partial [Saprospiraceae bacterium]